MSPASGPASDPALNPQPASDTDPGPTPPPAFGDHPGIVVGIDGSPRSDHALAWALARSDELGPVRPVLAWHYPWWAAGSPLPPPSSEFAGDAAQLAAEQADRHRSTNLLDPIVAQGRPGSLLVELGAEANLVVVGTRGHGAVTDALLGSVSSHVVAHAPVPVAVVPPSAPVEVSDDRIVVGIDGSPESAAALAWAVDHAPGTGPIEAIHSWHYPPAARASIPADEYEASARTAATVLQDTVARALADRSPDRRERVTSRVEFGDPRVVLHGEAEGAGLLVLGERGRGGVAHLLLGSVTTALAHRPPTALVVIPAPAG